MATVVHNEKELGEALKNDAIEIEIADENLTGHVIRIKITGAIAWAVAIGAIAVAVIAILAAPVTGGTSAVASAVAAPAAAAVLGVGTTTSATGIAVAAGGVSALNKLREYKIEKRNGTTYLVKQ